MQRQLDLSIHFNAYQQCSKPMGTETLWVSQEALASKVSKAIASVGLLNLGQKKRTDLFFLNHTTAPALLLEICFCDSTVDTDLYRKNFNQICSNIADVLGGVDEGDIEPLPEPEPVPEPEGVLFSATGKCSYFGGPPMKVSRRRKVWPSYSTQKQSILILALGPCWNDWLGAKIERTGGSLHRMSLGLQRHWQGDAGGRPDGAMTNVATDGADRVPADWGPNVNTGRVADLSPALMRDLGLETDVLWSALPYGED
jgi:hypothetical protein